jgi:hypothetical protein
MFWLSLAALLVVGGDCIRSIFAVACRRLRFSKTPIIKITFEKNPRRRTGSKSEPGASLLFQAATIRSGLILLKAIRGFFEAYLTLFEE